jgi:DNA-binding MarR family transcriptional regulator
MSLPITEFADRLSRIIPTMMKEFARQQLFLYRDQITLPQFIILDFLHIQGESKMKDLATFMNVSTAAMTGIVERLVRYKYVIRSFQPDDRRIIKVGLTTRGNELVRKINEQRRKMLVKVFGKVSEKDRQDYLRILTQIKDILLKEKQNKE